MCTTDAEKEDQVLNLCILYGYKLSINIRSYLMVSSTYSIPVHRCINAKTEQHDSYSLTITKL